MITNPVIVSRDDESQQFHSVDINSYLISKDVLFINGSINAQVAEIINSTLLYYPTKFKDGGSITIILSNTECLNFNHVFSIYESINLLRKNNIKIDLQINGMVTELAVLFAFLNADSKYMSESAVVQIRELKIDESFSNQETSRLQAVDLFAHLDYYEGLERQYFEILSKESGVPYDVIQQLHERIKTLKKLDLEELGFSFIN